jgi:hypothetical protein
MNNQTTENNQDNRDETKKTNLENKIRSSWLGWRDSNPRMLVPETSALPLGDTPLVRNKL